MIRVANKRGGVPGEYVGRPGPLGNPFSHLEGTLALYKVATRAEAVRRYEDWLTDKLLDKDPLVCGEMNRLYKILRNLPPERDLVLVCWCAPQACHAEVIARVLTDTLTLQVQRREHA